MDRLLVNAKPKERYEYIDAMRGFVMFFVVWMHISYTCYGIHEPSLLSYLIRSFRMPLFFFISGYLGYKSIDVFDFSTWKKLVTKKFKVLIITTLLVAGVYMLFTKSVGFPLKYWFTISLFLMFTVYYTISLIKKPALFVSFYAIVLILFFLLFIFQCITHFIPEGSIFGILYETSVYFHFFTLGIFAKKNNSKFNTILSNETFKLIMLLVFLFGFILIYVVFPDIDRRWLFRFAFLAVPGLLIVYMSFKKYADTFKKDRLLGRVMQYVGRRTLDIYLLHYFFITPIPFIVNWFSENSPNSITEFVVSSIYSALVISMCLLISKVLCVSKILENILFGRVVNSK